MTVDPRVTVTTTRCVVAEVVYDQARLHALDGHRFPFTVGSVLLVQHGHPDAARGGSE